MTTSGERQSSVKRSFTVAAARSRRTQDAERRFRVEPHRCGGAVAQELVRRGAEKHEVVVAEPYQELVDLVGFRGRKHGGAELVPRSLETVAHPPVVFGRHVDVAEPVGELPLEGRQLGVYHAVDRAVNERLLPSLERAHAHERSGIIPLDEIDRVKEVAHRDPALVEKFADRVDDERPIAEVAFEDRIG